MRRHLCIALTAGLAVPALPALAARLGVEVEIPRLGVAEYHRPYVAVWVEGPDRKVATDLAVWYDLDAKDNEGVKWLKDLRQWWRKSGRDLQMPVDGVSGATRAPGTHRLVFDGARAGLDKLPAGEYRLVVEAAREVGGRELLSVPFQWPAAAPQAHQARGERELGAVSVRVEP